MTSPYCHYKGPYRCPNAPATHQDRNAETFVLIYNGGKAHLKPLIYGDYCWYHEMVVNPVKPGKETWHANSQKII